MSTPVDLSQDTIEKLAKGIASGLGGSGGGSAPKAATGGFDWMGKFKTGVEASVDGLKQLASGSANVGTIFEKLSNVATGLDPTGITKGLSAIGQAGIDTTANINKLGRDVGGLDFAGNAAQFNANAKKMGLTQDESISLYRRNADQMTGLGRTVNEGANSFGRFQEEFSKTKFSSQLAAIGVNMEEQAELGAAYVSQNRFLNLQDQQARERTIASFAQYATQLDENSRLTGMSKKAQSDAVNEQAKNVRVMAAVSQMGEGAMERFKGMQSQIVGLGQNVQMAASALYTGGPKTAEERAAVAAMGPAAATFQKAVEMSKNATDETSRKEAAMMMERAKNELNAYQRTREFTDAVQTGQGATADAMRAQYEQNKYGAAGQFTAAQAGVTGASPADSARLAQAQQAQAERERLRLTSEGKPDTGAVVTQGINLGDKLAKEVTAGTVPVFEKLNTEVGRTVTNFNGINKLIEGTSGGKARDTVGEAAGQATDSVLNAIPGSTGNREQSQRLQGLMERLRQTRDIGTWGMTGQMFEPMDQVVKISKGEIVLDPEQAKNFVAGMGKSGGEGGGGGASSAPAPAMGGGTDATINDLLASLDQLNMSMGQLISVSAETATHSKRQISAIKGVSGNMWS
jgi:hypothetical protein